MEQSEVHPMKIATVEQMRNMDKRAITEFDIPDQILMENAGLAAYEVIKQHFDLRKNRFLVVCGGGNNGGDGLVVARKLFSNQAQVQLLLLSQAEKFKGSAALNYRIAQKMNIPTLHIDNVEPFQKFISDFDVIIDAIFGTGLDRQVGGKYFEIIRLINESAKPVISLDIPSGINGNTGQVMGIAVKAQMTVTFGLPKLGNLLFPGFEHNGKLFVTHISFSPQIFSDPLVKVQTSDPVELPEKPGDAHKGYCGKVLFVAGAANYLGAPFFSAQAFLKAGGGLSYLATPQNISANIAMQGPEIVFQPLNATAQGTIAYDNLDFLLDFAGQMEMVVVGPGTSLHEETQQLIRDLVKKTDKPVLIDGDGLTALAKDTSVLKQRQAPTILTPHPGEMARLMNLDIRQVQERRIEILRRACEQLNAIIVLKGAHTLTAHPDGNIYLNLTGNPGMATAGSGDVLTGTIAAMFALLKDPLNAARTGVLLHGQAGDFAAQEIGTDGLIARDILNFLPRALQYYRQNWQTLKHKYFDKITLL